MADDIPRDDEQQPDEAPVEETPAAEEPAAEEAPAEERPAGEETPAEAAAEEQPAADEAPEATGEAEVLPSDDVPGREVAVDATVSDDGLIEAESPAADVEGVVEADEPETPRAKPAIPGADLEVDIVAEGEDPLARAEREEAEAAAAAAEEQDLADDQPVAASIDLGAGARYTATGKRKTGVARVILKPGTGVYTVNGKTLEDFFPRDTLQRNIRQPLEAVGYETRMDVVARIHGGGVSSQAGALRHGISRALIDADPNLRGELKRRGFLTRDARVKERKKAGLKKARKRPQFSKR
jgi:small subunit ribosomal protein S9